jgi:hypothetical protein
MDVSFGLRRPRIWLAAVKQQGRISDLWREEVPARKEPHEILYY